MKILSICKNVKLVARWHRLHVYYTTNATRLRYHSALGRSKHCVQIAQAHKAGIITALGLQYHRIIFSWLVLFSIIYS